jgi:hypothetical protein
MDTYFYKNCEWCIRLGKNDTEEIFEIRARDLCERAIKLV